MCDAYVYWWWWCGGGKPRVSSSSSLSHFLVFFWLKMSRSAHFLRFLCKNENPTLTRFCHALSLNKKYIVPKNELLRSLAFLPQKRNFSVFLFLPNISAASAGSLDVSLFFQANSAIRQFIMLVWVNLTDWKCAVHVAANDGLLLNCTLQRENQLNYMQTLYYSRHIQKEHNAVITVFFSNTFSKKTLSICVCRDFNKCVRFFGFLFGVHEKSVKWFWKAERLFNEGLLTSWEEKSHKEIKICEQIAS